MSWYTEIACTDAAEFIEALDKTRSGFGEYMMIYRGHGDSVWELRPTLYRRPFGGMSFEIKIIIDFMLIAQRIGLAIPPDAMTFIALYNRQTNDKMTSLLHGFKQHKNVYEYDVGNIAFAMARHAEIPTRHLDFTWDPLVATYFAVDSAIEADLDKYRQTPKKIAVWALGYPDLQKNFGVIHHDWTHIPSLRNQQGLFLYDQTINVESLNCWTEAPSFEESLSQISFGKTNQKITLTFTHAILGELAEYLKRRDISKWRMFPTYQNVRNALMRDYEERNSP